MPSIHMPKEYARIWPDINAVRVERRQDISFQRAGDELTDPRASFG